MFINFIKRIGSSVVGNNIEWGISFFLKGLFMLIDTAITHPASIIIAKGGKSIKNKNKKKTRRRKHKKTLRKSK